MLGCSITHFLKHSLILSIEHTLSTILLNFSLFPLTSFIEFKKSSLLYIIEPLIITSFLTIISLFKLICSSSNPVIISSDLATEFLRIV
ncbi:hypothetical protein LS215_2761 [Sulfolobus islandicus L.S.2.15]|uniref:Uncharacterized protein n=1 Tax=Saccharolobus islandicus (strain L.S.2.15 / Lassen \|nr:hypothetical protein LS215_2761 [Sulfolobus islandicus L.S.2.15]